MATRIARAALGVVITATIVACEITPTDSWLPEPVASSETAAPPTVVDGGEPAPVTLRVVPLRDGSTNAAVGVGVPLDGSHLWATPAIEAIALVAGAEPEGAVPVTPAAQAPTHAVLEALSPASWQVPGRAEAVRAGDGLLRVAGTAGSGRERLTVIDVRGDVVVTTCPRAAAGPVFTTVGGRWLPAVWLPDPAGGCALLKRIDPDQP